MLRLVGLWGPVAAWMALIFFLSSLQMPPGSAYLPDWASHGGVYCALALLVCRALAGGVRAAPARLALVGALVSALYGVTDELHQLYVPHRTAEVSDVIKDLGGAVVGAALFQLLAPRWAAQPPPAA